MYFKQSFWRRMCTTTCRRKSNINYMNGIFCIYLFLRLCLQRFLTETISRTVTNVCLNRCRHFSCIFGMRPYGAISLIPYIINYIDIKCTAIITESKEKPPSREYLIRAKRIYLPKTIFYRCVMKCGWIYPQKVVWYECVKREK